MLTLHAATPELQEALGAQLAAVVPPRLTIWIEGDLGAGKTTLVRGFLRGAGYAGKVRSPTYTLVEPYETPRLRCHHFDLYRLAHPEELEYLGVRDLLEQESVLLVEWPERGGDELPPADLLIRIRYEGVGGMEGRRLELVPRTLRGQEVLSRCNAMELM